MKRVGIVLLTLVLTANLALAGSGSSGKRITIIPKGLSSYQRLKYKYENEVFKSRELTHVIDQLNLYIDDAEIANAILRAELNKKPAFEVKKEVITQVEEVDVIPWYMWGIIAVAAAHGVIF